MSLQIPTGAKILFGMLLGVFLAWVIAEAYLAGFSLGRGDCRRELDRPKYPHSDGLQPLRMAPERPISGNRYQTPGRERSARIPHPGASL